MNYKMVICILGRMFQFEAVFLMIPAIVGFGYREENAKFLLLVAVISALAGTIMNIRRPKNKKIHARDGFVITALGWILMSIMGALPFLISGEIPSFTDAVFETASGFTTTGASILTNIEAMSHGMLLWRSFTHWLGGMGVLVFILAVLPSSADEMHIMKAESPGPSVDKFVPKVRETALILYVIYFVMTVIEFLLLIISKMPAFDAVCISLGTAGTGGFAVKSSGCAEYSNVCQNIITVFMFLFGVNFKFYYLLLCKKVKDALRSEEVIGYFCIYAFAVTVVVFGIISDVGNFADSLRIGAFQVASVMTTTGFATADFNLWNTLPKGVMVMVMFCGACAGSTGGGMKVSRIIIYFKEAVHCIGRYIHPRLVRKIRFEGKSVDEEVLRTTNAFFLAYIFIFAVSLFLILFDNFDFETSFTSIVATINNIGPGLGVVGPYGGYAPFSNTSKWVFIFDMIAGRLELFPMLVLFYPATWKRG